ncbi:MAG: DUF6288 domain-containing protein [Planctomycetota bacterium]
MMPRAFLLTSGMILLASLEVWGIRDKDNQGRWEKRVPNGPDAEVPGFLVNLGPTGARAVLTEKTFIVKYVFKGSPAYERLRPGDVITGAFGRPFSSHTFGGGPHGYEGPIMDLGDAIERAEGKDGRLVLNVVRGSSSEEVTIPLEPIGAFSPTFPMNCRKSDLLRARALKYLAAHPEGHRGPAHARAAVALAFLASGDEATAKQLVLSWNTVPGPGTWTWEVSYQLITLAEYYLLTQDPAVLPTIKSLVQILRQDQYDGRILVWGSDVPGEQEKIDAAQQLYRGGFGHGPYTPGVGKNGAYGPNGYGPMQYPTILAVIGWQLAERCGVKTDPRGLELALEFIHRGTNEAGYVAYGGEFTLNNGYVDPVAWKKSREGDNYVGRAGASLIAHKLSPEFPSSAVYAEKNKSYLKKAYKSLPDGHACSVLGFKWGLLGAAAAEDETVLRTMFDYHKAWFNMMRCHDGSFVVQPGRDYADEGYYISSRFNPTAVMVLVLGLAYPRLQIQGIQVSIPGVNPKALAGPRLAAYKAIVAKNYGQAARLLEPGDPMGAWLEERARKTVDSVRALGAAGRWLELKEKLADLKRSFGGVPFFDQASAELEVAAKPFLAADQLLREGQPAKALAALGTLDSPPAKALRARIAEGAAKALADLEALEREGRWHSLRESLAKARPKLRGLIEERAKAWEEVLASPGGRAWIEAEKQYLRGELGAAVKGAAPGLLPKIDQAAREKLKPLFELEAKGDWYGLERELAALRTKLAGVPVFDERDAAWQAAFKTEPARTERRLGAIFARLKESGRKKDIEAFLKQAGDSYYAKEARELLKNFK